MGVVAIMGVLAAIAAPRFVEYVRKEEDEAAQLDVRNFLRVATTQWCGMQSGTIYAYRISRRLEWAEFAVQLQRRDPR